MARRCIDTKGRFVDAMLKLSETKDINTISVRDVLEETGAARQTFYNHFKDINDLILYVPISYFEKHYEQFYTLEGCIDTFAFAQAHRSFYRQLPHHEGQNCFRDSYLDWAKRIYYEEALDGAPHEITLKKSLIDAYLYGVVDVFLDWCAHDMEWPPEMVAGVIFNAKPAFLNGDPLPDSRKPSVES